MVERTKYSAQRNRVLHQDWSFYVAVTVVLMIKLKRIFSEADYECC
jgi:hypothetical protein